MRVAVSSEAIEGWRYPRFPRSGTDAPRLHPAASASTRNRCRSAARAGLGCDADAICGNPDGPAARRPSISLWSLTILPDQGTRDRGMLKLIFSDQSLRALAHRHRSAPLSAQRSQATEK